MPPGRICTYRRKRLEFYVGIDLDDKNSFPLRHSRALRHSTATRTVMS
jgi:hypothetical protein